VGEVVGQALSPLCASTGAFLMQAIPLCILSQKPQL